MSVQDHREPLVSVPLSSQPALVVAPSKQQSQTARTALVVLISVLVTSGIFMGVILGMVHQAKPQIDEARQVLTAARELMDYPNRLLHGSIPHVTNNLIQTDWLALSRNTTKLASAIKQIFDASTDWNTLRVAQYSSLVLSIASKVGALRPAFTPVPAPPDDQGTINVLSYFTTWLSEQMDRKDVQVAAQTCVAFLDNAMAIDWSGSYSWGKGRGYGSWDANPWKQSAQSVLDYCHKFADIPPSQWEDIEIPPVDDTSSPFDPRAPTTTTEPAN